MLNPVADFRNLIGRIEGNFEEGTCTCMYRCMKIRAMRSKHTYILLQVHVHACRGHYKRSTVGISPQSETVSDHSLVLYN